MKSIAFLIGWHFCKCAKFKKKKSFIEAVTLCEPCPPPALRTHCQPGAALPAAAAVPLRCLQPDTPRAAGPARRDVGSHQHRDGHRVHLSLPERRSPGRREGEEQAGPGGRVGLGAGGRVSPPAVHTALPRAQHRRPAGHPGLRRHIAG